MQRAVCLLTSLRAFSKRPLAGTSARSLCAATLYQLPKVSVSGVRRLNGSWQRVGRCHSSLAPADAAIEPQIPLCEREAVYTADLRALLDWRERALAAVETVGDTWLATDQGPSAEDLQTELGWLLDDALAGLASGSSGAWQAATWRGLERDLRSGEVAAQAAAQYRVQLREPIEALDALWARRLGERVPLQYLTSAAFWRDMVLSVGPGVLIPRPETELMIDFAEQAVAEAPALGRGPWVDLGTGSGALAVGLARALPSAPAVWAVDQADAPLAYVAFNAARLGVGARVRPVQGDWYEPLLAAGLAPGSVAGILSNPPYIPAEDLRGLQAEVGVHEPRSALCGGEGLAIDCLVPVCTGAVRMLAPGGLLVLETGGGEQALYVADFLRHLRASAGTGTASCASASSSLSSFSSSARTLSSAEASWAGGQAWEGLGDPAGSWAAGGDPAADGGSSSEEGWQPADERPAFSGVQIRKDLCGVGRFVVAHRAP